MRLRRGAVFLAVLPALLVQGCSGPATKSVTDIVTDQFPSDDSCLKQPKANPFMAKPLCGKYLVGTRTTPISAAQVTDAEGPAFIGAALSDSLRNCQDFISLFTAGQTSDNTILDIASIALSALATVFVPANTARALSAASTITQGTKGAINSDFYQQLTIGLFIQTINGTYFKEYSDFIAANQTRSFPQQYNQIEFFHKDCSIPFAAAQLSASQAKASTASPTTQAITADQLKDGAKFKGGLSGITYIISVKTSGTGTAAKTTYSYEKQGPFDQNAPAQPTSSEALLALLNADHAAAVKN